MARNNIPKGVRLLSWSTGVSWIGWGLVEALIPIFLFSFSQSYAETGILRSTYDIAGFLSLPLIGLLADRIASRTLIILGMLLYPFIGVGYFLAGATLTALFLVLTRIMHGIGNNLIIVGRNTYFRNHTKLSKVSTAFGYFDSVSTFLWILAVIASLFIAPLFKIHWLFLAIIPTYIIATLMVLRLEKDHHDKLKDGLRKVFRSGKLLADNIREIKNWNKGLQLMAFLNFFFGFIRPIVGLFIPIFAYVQGADIVHVILITIFFSLPALLGLPLGALSDKNRNKSIFVGLIGISFVLATLYFIDSYSWQLIAAFLLGLIFEFIGLASEGVLTGVAHRGHYGRVTGDMLAVDELGKIVGPIALGLLIDFNGMQNSFLIMAIITLMAFVITFSGRKHLRNIYHRKWK